jgi:hypothetical protein
MKDDYTVRVAKKPKTDGPWFVASLNMAVGDWACYTGVGAAENVGDFGDKVDEGEAATVFPQFAAGFKYRR